MIPKTIHYCWFGRQPKPDLAEHCIASWRRVHPEFPLVEWNEANSPLDDNAYVREAFAQGKWAFVSDYVRSKVMLDHGGIYLDTDMELKLPLDEFLGETTVCGFEVKGVPYSAFWMTEPQQRLARDFVAWYDAQPGFIERINTDVFSKLLVDEYGADPMKDEIQRLRHGVVLYPSLYFSQDLPRNYVSHHFNGSWFGGDPGNTHKNMVNAYGSLDRLVRQPGAEKAVRAIFDEHRIIDADTVLDLIPRERIEAYLRDRATG